MPAVACGLVRGRLRKRGPGGKTHHYQSTNKFSRRVTITCIDPVDEVGSHTDNGDKGNKLDDSHGNKSDAQGAEFGSHFGTVVGGAGDKLQRWALFCCCLKRKLRFWIRNNRRRRGVSVGENVGQLGGGSRRLKESTAGRKETKETVTQIDNQPSILFFEVFTKKRKETQRHKKNEESCESEPEKRPRKQGKDSRKPDTKEIVTERKRRDFV